MKGLWLLTLICLLTACAPSRIHLHSYNIPEKERDIVAKELKESGLDVVLSERKPPLLNMGSFIIYPKADGDNDDLMKILKVINEHGYSTGLIARNRVKNHEYRDGSNIGLYLVNSDGLLSLEDQLAAEFAVDITEVEFSSNNCPALYRLTLAKDGNGLIRQMTALKELGQKPTSQPLPLSWTRDDNRLNLNSDLGEQAYTYAQQYQKNGVGKKLIMTLTPYLKPELDKVPQLKCTFVSSTPLIE